MFYDQGDQNIHVNVGENGAKIEHVDFDTSLVRDPRYPVAQPRIAAWEDITLRSFFSKTDLSMHVERVQGGTSWPSLLQEKAAGNDLLEPEAPLVLVVERNIDEGPDTAGSHPELFTLSKAGLPVSIKAAQAQSGSDTWTWSTPAKILSDLAKLVLRRNRAMTAVKRSPTDTQVFFVSELHVLMGVRRLADDAWTEPMPLADNQPIHWLSNISVIARGDLSVDIFYIDRDNRIHTAWWPSTFTPPASQTKAPSPWPGSLHQSLPMSQKPGKSSIILAATALAAVSPSRDTILVFAVGTDHILYMASFYANLGWTPVSAVTSNPITSEAPSAPGDDPPAAQPADEPLLFPHTQLSALAISDTAVYVAAITELNVPCIYSFTLPKGNTTWILKERFQCPNKPPAPAPGKNPISDSPARSEGSAAAYTFNPFGDVVLRMQRGTPVLWIAGVTGNSPGNSAVVGDKGEKPAVGVKGDTSGLKGRTGGNRGLLFAKVRKEGMVWMLMK